MHLDSIIAAVGNCLRLIVGSRFLLLTNYSAIYFTVFVCGVVFESLPY